jgi:hypothetical protein
MAPVIAVQGHAVDEESGLARSRLDIGNSAGWGVHRLTQAVELFGRHDRLQQIGIMTKGYII